MVVTMNKTIVKKAVNEVIRIHAPLAKKTYIEIEKLNGEYTAWISAVNGYGSFTNIMISFWSEFDEIDVTYYDIHSGILSEPNRHQVNYRIDELSEF